MFASARRQRKPAVRLRHQQKPRVERGHARLRAYLAPGVMAQAALFIAIFCRLRLRELMLGVGGHGELWLDALVVVAFFVAMAAAATRAYPRAIL
jgi:hypothetical protein